MTVEQQLAERALAGRLESYAAEVRLLIDAAFAVVRRTGTLDPPVRDIVREAGLSNQAFYRHFPSKDALLLAVLADGQQRLVDTLTRRVASADEPRVQIARWIEGVMAQARDRGSAEATRPFTVNGDRLAIQFPDEVATGKAAVAATLAPAVIAAGGTKADAQLVHDLAMARMHDAIIKRRTPDHDEIEQLVAFCWAGVRHGT